MGSIALVALQYLASFLISAFRGNAAAAIFGPVIVLMLFFNIFAQLILFIAAWIATSNICRGMSSFIFAVIRRPLAVAVSV